MLLRVAIIGGMALVGLGAQCQQTTPAAPAGKAECDSSTRTLIAPATQLPAALTAKQKFALFAHNSYSPYRWGLAAAQAGIEQASDSIPEYGQGAAGYGKRYGASMAGQTTSEFFGTFLFPAVFHLDPRYFPKGQGPVKTRIEYAVSRTFITRTDSGRSQFNASKILGALASAAIANTYYPREDRTVGQTFARFGVQLGGSAGFNVVKEFLPGLRRRFLHKKEVRRGQDSTAESGKWH